MGSKLLMVKHVEWLMLWVEENPIKTPMSLREFMSTAFSSLIDIAPTTLDYSYAVELSDGRVVESSTILRGCILNLLGHSFNIDLMPVELGSFVVIIGIDWLLKYHAIIVCDEKVVRIPYGNEVLMIHGDGSDERSKSKLSIILCTKTQKYIQKRCYVFLAQKTERKLKTSQKRRDLKTKKKKSLDYNNSFLGEYECSSLTLDRDERREEEIVSLETRSNNVSNQEI
ncbi:putative reverse transcriptase domain-containing protein [Tanacetum coccineum]